MLHGIDVSNWQGDINWRMLKVAGVQFAAIKATEGLTIEDSYFERNWLQSKANGITRLAYHFLRPEYGGSQQADYMHQVIKSHGKINFGDGILLDLEVTDGHAPYDVLQCANSFVQHARKVIGKQVVLYTGPGFWQQLGNVATPTLATCPLWVASWGSIQAPDLPGLSKPAFWQYSSTGLYQGIPGQVDLDYFLGSRVQLHRILEVHL